MQLDRIEKINSLNLQVLIELHQVLNIIEESKECKIVVIEGSAGYFCTGMDLEGFLNNDQFNEILLVANSFPNI